MTALDPKNSDNEQDDRAKNPVHKSKLSKVDSNYVKTAQDSADSD
jgi:hypothetical protein